MLETIFFPYLLACFSLCVKNVHSIPEQRIIKLNLKISLRIELKRTGSQVRNLKEHRQHLVEYQVQVQILI